MITPPSDFSPFVIKNRKRGATARAAVEEENMAGGGRTLAAVQVPGSKSESDPEKRRNPAEGAPASQSQSETLHEL